MMAMKRDECLKVLVRHRTDEAVVAVYMAAQELVHISPSDLNYTFVGAMGLASSYALGLALARPDRRVIVLDGDGSLLMNLGSLVTIGAPANLVHCLCRNNTYETNGGIPLPSSKKVNFKALAKDAGYRTAISIDTIEHWAQQAPLLLRVPGPLFVELLIEPGKRYPEDFERLYDVKRRDAFMRALASR